MLVYLKLHVHFIVDYSGSDTDQIAEISIYDGPTDNMNNMSTNSVGFYLINNKYSERTQEEKNYNYYVIDTCIVTDDNKSLYGRMIIRAAKEFVIKQRDLKIYNILC